VVGLLFNYLKVNNYLGLKLYQIFKTSKNDIFKLINILIIFKFIIILHGFHHKIFIKLKVDNLVSSFLCSDVILTLKIFP